MNIDAGRKNACGVPVDPEILEYMMTPKML
jgi:hypothetical protein